MSKPFKAFLIDLSILIIFLIPLILWNVFTNASFSSHLNWESHIYQDIRDVLKAGILSTYYLIILVYLIFKDVLNISFGKRKYQLKIIDRKTGKEVHGLKKILRNLTFLIPLAIVLEFIFKIITPKARFGDMLFDTEIRESSKVIPN